MGGKNEPQRLRGTELSKICPLCVSVPLWLFDRAEGLRRSFFLPYRATPSSPEPRRSSVPGSGSTGSTAGPGVAEAHALAPACRGAWRITSRGNGRRCSPSSTVPDWRRSTGGPNQPRLAGVVTRKVWAGNRTPNGARTQSVLLSLLQTYRQQNRPVLPLLERLRCSPRPRVLDLTTPRPLAR